MKPVTRIAIIVFVLMAAVQLVRVLFGWEVTIDGFVIPIWASIVVCIAALALAALVYRENRQNV